MVISCCCESKDTPCGKIRNTYFDDFGGRWAGAGACLSSNAGDWRPAPGILGTPITSIRDFVAFYNRLGAASANKFQRPLPEGPERRAALVALFHPALHGWIAAVLAVEFRVLGIFVQ